MDLENLELNIKLPDTADELAKIADEQLVQQTVSSDETVSNKDEKLEELKRSIERAVDAYLEQATRTQQVDKQVDLPSDQDLEELKQRVSQITEQALKVQIQEQQTQPVSRGYSLEELNQLFTSPAKEPDTSVEEVTQSVVSKLQELSTALEVLGFEPPQDMQTLEQADHKLVDEIIDIATGFGLTTETWGNVQLTREQFDDDSDLDLGEVQNQTDQDQELLDRAECIYALKLILTDTLPKLLRAITLYLRPVFARYPGNFDWVNTKVLDPEAPDVDRDTLERARQLIRLYQQVRTRAIILAYLANKLSSETLRRELDDIKRQISTIIDLMQASVTG